MTHAPCDARRRGLKAGLAATLGLLAIGAIALAGGAHDQQHEQRVESVRGGTRDNEAAQPRLNFTRLPIAELADQSSEPPSLDEAYEALFQRAQSTMIDIEYLTRLSRRYEDARAYHEAGSQLSVRFSRQVFEPTRWSVMAIDLARQNPARPAELSEADLWRGYHLLIERYETLHASYAELREHVLGAAGVEALDTSSFRRPDRFSRGSN